MNPSSDFDELSAFATIAGRLVRWLHQPEFHAKLQAELRQVATFDNFIVYLFSLGKEAQLAFTNLNRERLARQMREFDRGLYLLDPFYVASSNWEQPAFVRLDEVAPEKFRETEFYRLHYSHVRVLDEVRYIVPLGGGEFVHVFVEREDRSGCFEVLELARLRSISSFVAACVLEHWAWKTNTSRQEITSSSPIVVDLAKVIGNIRPGALTSREISIVSRMLQGHSAKSIARDLDIAEGTVSNHKRNIYAKLEIHSQAQLFHKFLNALTASPV